MRSDVRLTVGPGPAGAGTVHEMKGGAPIAWRRTPDAVYMVGTAASPVGTDDVAISVRVLPGASLTLRSVAASIAWAGGGTRQVVRVTVEEGAELRWRPEPLIATAGCTHLQDVSVDLHPSAKLRWRDLLVLGREAERPGALESRLRIVVGGAPLLYHTVALGDGHPGWDGPAVLGSAKVLGQLAVAGAGADETDPAAATLGDGPGCAAWSVTPLPGPGCLATVVASRLAAAQAAMAAAESHLEGSLS